MSDAQARAERARQILEDDLFVEMVERLHEMYLDDVMRATDDDARREAVANLRALRDVREAIQTVLVNGMDKAMRDMRAKGIA